MRITNRLLDKYGYTDGCIGSVHKQADLYDNRQHSTACRTRIYELIKDDEEELDKMERVEVRLGRMPLRDEQIRRGTAPMREATGAARSTSQGWGWPQRPESGSAR